MAINLTDSDALERLEEKLKKLTDYQETMKGINVVVRDKRIADAEKIKTICERFHVTPESAQEIVHPKESWHSPGIQSWQLSNNSAEIRRIKQRIEEVVRYRNEIKKTEEAGGLPEFEFDGGKIVDNIPENRLQIFFDDKPEAEVRTQLKRNGFRWAPSNGAWQSYRNHHTLTWAKQEFHVGDTPCAEA